MTSPQNSATVDARRPSAVPRCDKHQCDKLPWSVNHTDALGQAVALIGHGLDGFSCPRCDSEAVDRAAATSHREHDDRRQADAAKRRQLEIESRLGAAGIPARYREYNFDTFPAVDANSRKACNILRSYANRFLSLRQRGVSALLVGGTGTGKTGLALSVANKIMREDGATALFMTAYGAVRHQRDTWGRKGRTEREALNDLLNADLLILDEVGTSVGSDFETAALFEVINGRYADRKPTFLLSNLPMDDFSVDGVTRTGLRTFLGQRLVDRFRDDSSFTLAFDWPSLRGARQ